MAITKEELDKYIEAYMRGESLITDEEYDMLVEEYVKEHGEESRPFNRQKQSAAINDIVGTLSKVYGVTSPMREGQDTYIDWKRRKGIPDDATIIIQPKLDGGSVAMDFKSGQFATRGDYDNGESEDVTELFYKNNSNIIQPIINTALERFRSLGIEPLSIKFESIMSQEDFKKEFDQNYKRPRDAMSAIMHSRNKEYVDKYIKLKPLRVMTDKGMFVHLDGLSMKSLVTTADNYEGIQKFIENILADGATVFCDDSNDHIECDGVVVSVVDSRTNMILHEVAIKILNMVKTTKLISISYQMGTTGRVTPVAVLEPVKFGDVTVDRATLSNLYRVNQLQLRYNDTVHIMYNIVPYFLSSDHDGGMPIPMLDRCPSCKTPFNMNMLRVVECTNPNCSTRKLGNIVRYCKNMKMMGIAEETINDLFDAGIVKEIQDLYNITADDIKSIKGYKDKSANNIIDSIKKASTNVPLERWLGSLPITGISTKIWKLMIGCSYGADASIKFIDHIKSIINNNEGPETLLVNFRIPAGVGTRTMFKIAEGVRLNWETICILISSGKLTFAESKIKKSNGIKIGMSGTRDAQLTNHLDSKGYEVCDYNNSCSILVIPYKGFTSSKVEKAKKHGKTIITVEEAYKL